MTSIVDLLDPFTFGTSLDQVDCVFDDGTCTGRHFSTKFGVDLCSQATGGRGPLSPPGDAAVEQLPQLVLFGEVGLHVVMGGFSATDFSGWAGSGVDPSTGFFVPVNAFSAVVTGGHPVSAGASNLSAVCVGLGDDIFVRTTCTAVSPVGCIDAIAAWASSAQSLGFDVTGEAGVAEPGVGLDITVQGLGVLDVTREAGGAEPGVDLGVVTGEAGGAEGGGGHGVVT